MTTVVYAREPGLDAPSFIDILHRSGLAERRPVGEPERIAAMLAHADLILTARDEAGRLIGVSRAVTDFSYCCYLSDLAVDRARQGRGIGRELIRRTREAAGGEAVGLILLAAPAAADYYPKIGMAKLDTCFAFLRPRPD
jgi:predicted N-acetyltransferase YhbS